MSGKALRIALEDVEILTDFLVCMSVCCHQTVHVHEFKINIYLNKRY